MSDSTPPPPDPWGRSEARVTPVAPGLDPWGRPLAVFDPAANRGVLQRSAARLRGWLVVFMAVQVVGGVVSALTLVLGGRLGLNLLESVVPGLNLPGSISWLLGLAAALVLALALLYVLVAGWARELITRLAAWALAGPQVAAPDARRTEQLRRTLGGWLGFGQWGTAAIAGLSAVFGVVAVVLGQAQLQQTLSGLPQSPGTDAGVIAGLNSGFAVLQVLPGLLASVPAVVITWLILGAIRRFMDLSVGRLNHTSAAPVTPAARVVGNWFVLCLVLVGLSALQLLAVLVFLLAAFSVLRQNIFAGLPGQWSGLINALPGVIGGFLLYALAVYGLYFALLLLSRTYALALARQLDVADAPAAPAAPPSGAAPNIYRGPAL